MRHCGFLAVLAVGLIVGPLAHAQDAVTVVDARPPEQSVSKLLSINVYDCKYAIKRLGADAKRPVTRVKQLEADLSSRLGARLAGKTVTLKDYRLYINNSSAATNQAMVGGRLGAVGALAYRPDEAPAKSKCVREKTPEGWFSSDEVSSPYAPLILHIAVEIDGRPYAVRYVYSTTAVHLGTMLGKDLTQPEAAPFVTEAFTQANAKLIDLIAADLP